MNRNLRTRFFLGLAGSVVIGLAGSIAFFEYLKSELLTDLEQTVYEAKHQDTYLSLAFIQMVENGETERLIRAYCTLLQMRLKYIDPETIENTELRIKAIENKNEGELVLARLESEGKCLTNR